MTNRSDNNDSSTETSTNGKNPKKTLAKRGGTAGGKRVSTLSTPLSSNESYVNGHLSETRYDKNKGVGNAACMTCKTTILNLEVFP